MSPTELWTGLVASALAALHVWSRHLALLQRTPRSIWLSASGGIAVAYVFLHLLPQLHEGQQQMERQAPWHEWAGAVEHELFLVALAGLSVFYGLERLAASSRVEGRSRGGEDRTSAGVFALHIGSFALYNLLVGYLLLHGEHGNLGQFSLAMGLHFLVNDHGLRAHHKLRYDRAGRWVLAGAVMAGWLVGRVVELSEVSVLLLMAFLAGGVILNVMKEELPQERESRFDAFLAGAAGYWLLLLLA